MNTRDACDWPIGEFTFLDEPGEHDPCYVIMPGGAMLPVNHHAGEGVDIARAKFIIAACNEKLCADSLVSQIAQSVDRWREAHPDLSVMDTLAALEEVRHGVTELFIKHGKE